ncbi:MAG: ribosome biogenesis GTPase Der [Actinomycetota bacterium]
MSTETSKVAILGRQNVGKSTLVNRIVGRRAAIAHDMPGVTRDRVELDTAWRGRRFTLVDTAGFLTKATGIEAAAQSQAAHALAGADLVLLVVDIRAGVTEEDARLARSLRRVSAPVIVVANKCDTPSEAVDAVAFHRLGLGEPIVISALHGQGVGELLDAVVALLPERPNPDATPLEPRFAIVGRPNVGKSSLFNRLVGTERSLVSDVPGTTRDTVDSVIEWPDLGRVRFVDTAGMRRGQKVRGIEYFSFLRATEAIERAHVAVLVLDASDGFTTEDKKIAARVMEAGRAFLVVANKWDLVQDKDRTYKRLQGEIGPFARAEAVRTSAVRGQGVHRLPPILVKLQERWNLKVSTSRVNQILQEAQGERPTPRVAGNLHYATQTRSGPPSFVIFGGAKPPGPGYERFLENRFRRELGLEGVPVRLRFRPRSRTRTST